LEDGLKQRLVGAIALIGLAVIFLPALLDGKKDTITDRKPVVLPERPKFEVIAPFLKDRSEEQQAIEAEVAVDRLVYGVDTSAIGDAADENVVGGAAVDMNSNKGNADSNKDISQSLKNKVDSNDSAETGKKTEVAKTTVESTQSPLAKAEVSTGLTPTWTVQLASFSDTQNADQLKEKLLDDKFHAYTESFQTNGKSVVRVFVGPEVTKKGAESIQRQLQQRYQLEGMIVRYVP
jgi:DedD protein